jgi:hypothetical protein
MGKALIARLSGATTRRSEQHPPRSGQICYLVVHAVAWTLADLAGRRTSPGRDEVAADDVPK